VINRFAIETAGQQLIEITDEVQAVLDNCATDTGLLTLFIQHTSASLVIQENADASVQTDLLSWMNRLVPEHATIYTHTSEGPDDMPAHIKSALTQTSLSIPFENGRLLLGNWQGIYLFEHRRSAHRRSVIVHIGQ
jgi:secondary thiamine-phosphate synthase enzyme